MILEVHYNGHWIDTFTNELEAEEFIMESAAWGAVVEKENGDERDLVEIEKAEMAMYEVIKK